MMGRVIEISQDAQHLALFLGFMLVKRGGNEITRIALDDIGVLLCHAHGLTYSNNLFFELSRRGAAVVLCGDNHLPYAWLWPIEAYHAQAGRMQCQVESGKPLRKRLWQQLVRAKIGQQAAILSSFDLSGVSALERLVRKVRSGDPDNIEAQAARLYWPHLMGSNFVRDRRAGGANALLNYGYTILRAATARAVAASGLHPSIGIHHRNRLDNLCLVDDLMEPFRPIIDWQVAQLLTQGVEDVNRQAKKSLSTSLFIDMESQSGETTPVTSALMRLAGSLARSLEQNQTDLVLPYPFTGW